MIKLNDSERIIALAGNPNVGKSTVFNYLTGMKQHTGNWAGKTVVNARGRYCFNNRDYILVDLPGTYSITAHSAEEEVARDFILNGGADATIVVCDATCLERNLNLVMQIMEITPNAIVCANLLDEAEKKSITIDIQALEKELGIPVVGTSARSGKGLTELMKRVEEVCAGTGARLTETAPLLNTSEIRWKNAERIASKVCIGCKTCSGCGKCGTSSVLNKRDRKLDKILTSRLTGIPIMLALLCIVFWITVTGAQYPSDLLFKVLFWVGDRLAALLHWFNVPEWFNELIIMGVYRVLAWVVAVMLPPMAIFFPLFTLLEDFGYLPRVAFNLDHHFKKAKACGKQALTMCMGFGCNAAGVTGCRIIDSPRERLIAIITNNFVICNGRFPTLIAIISMFFVGMAGGVFDTLLSALILTGVIILGVILTFLISRLLSETILKGEPSSFTLELPPYRTPQIGRVIVRSVFDRTLFVLGRAVAVAVPAGLVIWLLANIKAGDISLLNHCSSFIDPFARIFGLDGVILLAFILGFPANEIVFPIIIMSYMSAGSILEIESLTELRALLTNNGWTWVTAVSTMMFCLCHWPCSTACLTIKKETGGVKWVGVSMLVPTVTGLIICFIFTTAVRLSGLI
ncbi:MAG: ferrous iron transporter B [Oscillospiraceae bacterium]|nr:ferrous iron transporter B [Oscillospiraceae bacterium]